MLGGRHVAEKARRSLLGGHYVLSQGAPLLADARAPLCVNMSGVRPLPDNSLRATKGKSDLRS